MSLVHLETLSVQEVYDYIVPKLKEHGIVVQRHDAKHTQSIYLKLDYGVAGSIRLSDHQSQRTHYRYNVECQRARSDARRDAKGRLQYFYVATKPKLDNMVAMIVGAREKKIADIGEEKYQIYMQSNQKHYDVATSWSDSKIV